MIPLFDLHCDTLTELYNRKLSYFSSSLSVSEENAAEFSPYIQVAAVWSDCRLSNNEAYFRYKEIIKYISTQNMYFCTSVSKFREKTFVLAIEDARILDGDIFRLDEFYSDNVRFLTLMWKGVSCIGGAWDTDLGLTDFGKDAINRSFELGIVPDISHASEKSAKEIVLIAEKCGKPIVATHSNSFSVCPHPRNLKDEAFKYIKEAGGIVGISLAPHHLSSSCSATTNDILKHIEHYLMLEGEDCICLGCDFDGVDSLPKGITDLRDLKKLYLLINKEFGAQTANKIFFGNAYSFACANLK